MPLTQVSITKIIRETGTTGSSPLLVMDEAADTWFAKSTTYPAPYAELINEIICNRIAALWGFIQPELGLGIISADVVSAYRADGGQLSQRYTGGMPIYDRPFLFSRQLTPATELEAYTGNPFDGREWRGVWDRKELARIAIFDQWICNRDRKPENPNVLLLNTNNGIRFVPFDHTAAFGSFANHKAIPNVTALYLPRHLCLTNHPFTSALLTFDAPDSALSLKDSALQGMDAVLSRWNDVVADVPAAWGFSRAARQKLHQLLSDAVRNETVATTFGNL